MLLESEYQRRLMNKIRALYPGAIILKNDPAYLQGFPDWLVLYTSTWAALEVKRSRNSRLQPNQAYYTDLADSMSFGRIVFPENETEVLRDLQYAFKP